jgi:hypothetical protein
VDRGFCKRLRISALESAVTDHLRRGLPLPQPATVRKPRGHACEPEHDQLAEAEELLQIESWRSGSVTSIEGAVRMSFSEGCG